MPLPQPLRFVQPKLVVKNLTSTKEVVVIGKYNLSPGETADLFQVVAPGSLTEDQIIRSLFLPDGDMYVEVVLKGTLQILEIDLPSFYYSKVFPTNLVAANQATAGAFPVAISEDEFRWYSFQLPLVLQDDKLVLPRASPTQDGYLSKEDYTLFASVAAGGNFTIWQYQDFTAPVASSLTLTAFENGSGLAFNAGYILSGTASVVLISDTERPPTAVVSIPGVWLTSNRVEVSSHIGTTVVLNQAPHNSLPVRVFYQIALPAGISTPGGYEEDPNFVNERELDFFDDFYVNQNGDETIYGTKTFNDTLQVDGSLVIPTGAVDGYYLRSNGSGTAAWAPVVGGGGTSDHGALTGLGDDDHPQYYNQARLDPLIDGYEPSDSERLLPVGGTTGQALVKTSNSDYDVQWEDVATGTSLDLSSLDVILDGYVSNTTFATTIDGYTTDAEFSAHTGNATIHFTVESLNLDQYIDGAELDAILDGYALPSQIITDHGGLSGLGDDDHPQYYNQSRLSSVIDGYIYDAENVGNDGYGVFYQKVGDTIQFKNIAVGSTKLTIAEASNNIVIDTDTDVLRFELGQVDFEPTGFPNRDDSIISFADGSRTLTIQPTGGSFDIYLKAQRVAINSARTVIIPDATGLYYVYFDRDTYILTATPSFNLDIIYQHAFVAVVYWNSTAAKHIHFGEERHGVTMDGVTHAYLHQTNGSVYVNGLSLDNIVVDGSGDVDTDAQFTSTSGLFLDEDIRHSIPIETEIPVYYRSGSDGYWFVKDADTFPVIYSGTAGYTGANGRLPYNDFDGSTWSLKEVPNNNFMLVHVFATNDIVKPIIAIQGIASYATITAARTAAREEIGSLTGLPFVEFVAIGTVIYQTANGYANIPQARIRSVDGGLNYIDWRQTPSATGSISSDHGLLSGLNDDDHTHYYNAARLDLVLDGYATTVQLDLHADDSTIHFTVGDLGLDGYFYKSADQTVSGHTTFDPSVATNPALTISPNGATPTTNVADGSVAIVGGIQYNYDGTRAKWLSNERKFLVSGRNANNVTNAYINVIDGVVSSSTGYRLLRDATITGIWAQTEDIETWVFEIRRNGVVTVVASLSITASRGDSDPAVNVDVNADDEIQFYVNGTGIGRPVVGIELAWRIT